METTETLQGVPINFSSLSRESVSQLAPALKKAHMTIAYEHLAEPVVAKLNDGTIIGFAFAQLMPHAEPIYVDPNWRGIGIAEELARRVVEKIESTGAQRFVAVAQGTFAEELCKKMGMRAVLGVVYVKEP